MKWKPAILDRSRPAVRASEWGALTALVVMLFTFLVVFGGWRNRPSSWQEILECNRHIDRSAFWLGFNPFNLSVGAGIVAGSIVSFVLVLRSSKFRGRNATTGAGSDETGSGLAGHSPLTPPTHETLRAEVLDVFVRCSDLASAHKRHAHVREGENIPNKTGLYAEICRRQNAVLARLTQDAAAVPAEANAPADAPTDLAGCLKDYYLRHPDWPRAAQRRANPAGPAWTTETLSSFMLGKHGKFVEWLEAGGPDAPAGDEDTALEYRILYAAIVRWHLFHKYSAWLRPAALSPDLLDLKLVDSQAPSAETDDDDDELGLSPIEKRRYVRDLWDLIADMTPREYDYVSYYDDPLDAKPQLDVIESRLKWYRNRQLSDLLDGGCLKGAISVDETLRDLLQRMTDQFSAESMVKAGMLAPVREGEYDPPLALVRDAPIYPHYGPDGSSLALSHSFSPILGTTYDDILWDRLGLCQAGKTDGILYVTSGIYYADELRRGGFNAVAIHPFLWAHGEHAFGWPLPRFLVNKLRYGAFPRSALEIEGFAHWFVGLIKENGIRRIYYDLSPDYPRVLGRDSHCFLVAPRFLFRHFVLQYLARDLEAAGIEVVHPTNLLWSVFRETRHSRWHHSPDRVLESAMCDFLGEAPLLDPGWNIVEPYQASVLASAGTRDIVMADVRPASAPADSLLNLVPKDEDTLRDWHDILGWSKPRKNAKDIKSINDLALYIDYLWASTPCQSSDELVVPGIDRPIRPESVRSTLNRRLKKVPPSKARLAAFLAECTSRFNKRVIKC